MHSVCVITLLLPFLCLLVFCSGGQLVLSPAASAPQSPARSICSLLAALPPRLRLWLVHTVFFISQPPSWRTHFSPGLRQSWDRNGILRWWWWGGTIWYCQVAVTSFLLCFCSAQQLRNLGTVPLSLRFSLSLSLPLSSLLSCKTDPMRSDESVYTRSLAACLSSAPLSSLPFFVCPRERVVRVRRLRPRRAPRPRDVTAAS